MTTSFLPWLYSRTWIGDNVLLIDCISTKEIEIGDEIYFTMHETMEERKMFVSEIQYKGDAPMKMQDKELQNCYYKLKLIY